MASPPLIEKPSATDMMAPGIEAMMPAVMISEMPLPMPYLSICSPSHIKKTVPAVRPISPQAQKVSVLR